MALYFQKKGILGGSIALKNLVIRFQEYTFGIDYTTADEENCRKSRASIMLLECAIKQLREKRTFLLKSYEDMYEEYRNCKTKSEKKDLMVEIDQIEEESQLEKNINDGNNLILKLMTKAAEYRCANEMIGLKLGYIAYKSAASSATTKIEQKFQVKHCTFDHNTVNCILGLGSFERNQALQGTRQSKKHPQASLSGVHKINEVVKNRSESEHLIHQPDDLGPIRRATPPRKSLRNRTKAAKENGRILPPYHTCIAKRLKSTNCNTMGALQVVAKNLSNRRPVRTSFSSCIPVSHSNRRLRNQTIGSEHNVCHTRHLMREETTSCGLLRGVVKPLQLAGKSQDRQTAEDLLAHPKIGAADNGCGDNIHGRQQTCSTHASHRNLNQRWRSGSVCHFCRKSSHGSMTCKGNAGRGICQRAFRDGCKFTKICSSRFEKFSQNKGKHQAFVRFSYEFHEMKDHSKTWKPGSQLCSYLMMRLPRRIRCRSSTRRSLVVRLNSTKPSSHLHSTPSTPSSLHISTSSPSSRPCSLQFQQAASTSLHPIHEQRAVFSFKLPPYSVVIANDSRFYSTDILFYRKM